jgi:acetamidase/formamidase
MRRMALFVVLSALLASIMSAAAADHELKLIPSNTHTGSFDARIKPVLRIAPGDTVKVETLVPFGMDRLVAAGASEAEIPDSVKAMDKYMKEKGLYGGPLTGPIYIEGAQTGDMLEVQILPGFEFLHPYGWTGFRGRGTLPDDFPYARYKLFRIDVAAGTIQFSPRITIKTSPFWGMIGVAACRGPTPAISTSRNWCPAPRFTSPCTFPARSSRSATATRCRATGRSTVGPWKRRCAVQSAFSFTRASS